MFPSFHMCHLNFEMMQMMKSMFSISRRFRGNFKVESKIPGEENILLENDEVKLEFSGGSGLLKVNRKIDRCLTLPRRIFRHIFQRLCVKSTQKNARYFFEYAKVNCDWPLTSEVTKIFYRLGFADGISPAGETRAEKNRIFSQAREVVERT